MSVGSPAHGDLRGGTHDRGARRAGSAPSRASLAVAGLTVLGAALRFYGLGHQGFWFDEANTAQLVRFPPGKMLGLIPQTESTPPLYYCVAWVWSRVFGDGEAGLRSLSAVAGVALVPVAYLATTQLISRRAGLIAAALTAANPLLIWYSQEARSYELLVLLTAVALLAFAMLRAAPSGRRAALWAVASALALATHYYAVIAILPQAAWLAYEHRSRRPVRIALGIVALCGLALIPLALSQNSTGHDSWIAHASLRLRLAQIIPQFLIGTGAPARTLLKFLAIALALAELAALAAPALPAPALPAARARGAASAPERSRALAAGALALVGFALSLAFVAAGSDALITRNILPIWLPLAMLVAGSLAGARSRALGPAVTVALCVIGVVATVGVATDRNLQRPDWRGVARVLGPSPARGSARVILIQHYRTLLPLSLYLPALKVLHRPAAVREIDVVSISSPQQPLCWWGAACNLIPSRMQAAYDVPGFHELWRRRIDQFTILRLVADRPVRVSRTRVSRALTATTLRNDDLLIQRS